LVAYALKITDLDPIRHVLLLFERFLNPSAVRCRDIDVDFCIRGRAQVIQYVKINTAPTAWRRSRHSDSQAKAAIRDVGRALGLSFAETDAIAKLIPRRNRGFDYPLTEAMKMEPRLGEMMKNDPRIKTLMDHALRLEGLVRHASTHAAAWSCQPAAGRSLAAVCRQRRRHRHAIRHELRGEDRPRQVRLSGLKTLTLIHDCLKLIEITRGETMDVNRLPLDDKKTYRTLCNGNTTGVFQLESTASAR